MFIVYILHVSLETFKLQKRPINTIEIKMQEHEWLI